MPSTPVCTLYRVPSALWSRLVFRCTMLGLLCAQTGASGSLQLTRRMRAPPTSPVVTPTVIYNSAYDSPAEEFTVQHVARKICICSARGGGGGCSCTHMQTLRLEWPDVPVDLNFIGCVIGCV